MQRAMPDSLLPSAPRSAVDILRAAVERTSSLYGPCATQSLGLVGSIARAEIERAHLPPEDRHALLRELETFGHGAPER